MDPVSHLAFGRLVIALDGDRRLDRGATVACLVGSMSPDLDAVFMPVGWDVYLVHHQGGTHSVIGSIACAALVAAVATLSVKRCVFRGLLLAAWAGAAGHLLLDLVSGADLRLLWPFGPRTALPLFAMADPWLASVLVIGVIALFLRRRDQRRTGIATLLAVAVAAGGKGAFYVRAVALNCSSGATVESTRADAEWGSLTRWIMYDTRRETVDARRIDALTGTVSPLLHVARGLQNPLVVRSRQFQTVRNFLGTHDATFAIVNNGGREVLWSDLRYCGPFEARSVRWAPVVPVRASTISCALWVGGEIDPGKGTLGSTIVYIGHFVQRRVNR
jgi:membrane-bound metal-dependent hydrolase YbcI (DUF457 family)